MGSGRLLIGQVAVRSGVTAKTIRYYEALGLIPDPPRTPGGYRLYSSADVDLLRFVKQAQGLGLTLEEIREIVGIRHHGALPCVHVQDLLFHKLRDIDTRIRELTGLRKSLRAVLRGWQRRARAGNEAVVCPHIESHPNQAEGGRKPRSRSRRSRPAR
ncbi:MAG: heavy metal-responsive transcriptional regulator [Candidatus Methylomirabilales bacterium]